MPLFNRRNFLKTSGAGFVPALFPFSNAFASRKMQGPEEPLKQPIIKLFGDGEMFEPADYLNELQKVNAAAAIVRDRYGAGGAVEELEKKFAAITGKEKAVYMPSGTMANQLAIAVLSGEHPKVFVQETSHVYRDEADAAQSVFQRRLMPLAKGEAYFTAQQLQTAVDNLKTEEYFQTGIGAVSIENPVRRSDGRFVPLEEIKNISAYCRANNIKLHLDGARVYLASAWSGVPVKEYASYFDTVYISLYKYLGASGGAILCGDKAVIDKMHPLIKVHGGNMYGNWLNAAMALNRLDGLETRLQEAKKRAGEIFGALNKLRGIKVTEITGGTNIYNLNLAREIDGKKLQSKLHDDFSIVMPRPNENNEAQIAVNETLLYQSADYVVSAFRKSL